MSRNTVALRPAEDLAPAIAHLPEPTPARGTIVGVGVERTGGEPVAVEFRTDVRRIGSDLEWVYEGPLTLDGDDETRDGSDLAATLRERLGDRCEEVRIQSHQGPTAEVLAFFRAVA